MIYKTALKTLAVIVYFYFCVYAFNHINAWIGIFMFFFGVVFLINYLINTKF